MIPAIQSSGMEEEQSHMTERILHLTLQIISLLTGERCAVVKMASIEGLLQGLYPPLSGEQHPITAPAPASPTPDKNIQQKVLEVIRQVAALLSKEVSIRSPDVAIYLSVEERERLEGDMEAMMEGQPVGGSDERTAPERRLHPPPHHPGDPTQEGQETPPQHQNENPRQYFANTQNKVVKTEEDVGGPGEPPEDRPSGGSDERTAIERRLPDPHPGDPSQEGQETPPQQQKENVNQYIVNNQNMVVKTEEDVGGHGETPEDRPSGGSDERTAPERRLHPPPHPGDSPQKGPETPPQQQNENGNRCFMNNQNMVVKMEEDVEGPDEPMEDRPSDGSRSTTYHESIRRHPGGHHSPEQSGIPPREQMNGQTRAKELSIVVKREEEAPEVSAGYGAEVSGEPLAVAADFQPRSEVLAPSVPVEAPLCLGPQLLLFRIGTSEAPALPLEQPQTVEEGAPPLVLLRIDPPEPPQLQAPPLRSPKPASENGDEEWKPFQCSKCGKHLSSKSSLYTHEKRHRRGRPYQCSTCGKCFGRTQHLKRHWMIHTGEKPFECQLCGKRFAEERKRILHEATHRGHEPPAAPECLSLAPESPPRNDDLAPIIAKDKKLSQNPRLILFRINTSESPLNLQSISLKKTQPACQNTGAEGTSPLVFLKINTSEGPPNPQALPPGTPKTAPENPPNPQASPPKTPKIESEDPPSPQASPLKTRKSDPQDPPNPQASPPKTRKSDPQDPPNPQASPLDTAESDPEDPPSPPASPFETPESDPEYHPSPPASFSGVTRGEAEGTAEYGKFQCSKCKKYLSSKYSLIAHERNHSKERKLSCIQCGKRFASKQHLQRHWMIHTGEKPYECRICGRRFVEERKRRLHEETHRIKAGNEKIEEHFSCSVCNKVLSTRSSLRMHLKSHRPKSYSCLQCKKNFTDQSDFLKHQEIHIDDRPFRCSVCGKCFKKRSHLSEHQQIHTGERPFTCRHCNKSFMRRSHLQDHQRIHMARLFCPDCGRYVVKNTHVCKASQEQPELRRHSCLKCGKAFAKPSHVLRHESQNCPRLKDS